MITPSDPGLEATTPVPKQNDQQQQAQDDELAKQAGLTTHMRTWRFCTQIMGEDSFLSTLRSKNNVATKRVVTTKGRCALTKDQ